LGAESRVILLVKYPEKGGVKMRLARQIGDDFAVELYRNFVMDSLAMLKRSGIPFIVCFHPADKLEAFRAWLGPQCEYVPQRGSDLGERLKNGFMDIFSKGFCGAMAIGSDSPDLPEEIVIEAREALELHDAVIGPSTDGGYYLIGFKSDTFLPKAFEGIAWSTDAVFVETVDRLRDAALDVLVLPPWSDVDTFDDLVDLCKGIRNLDFASSETMKYLIQHGEGLIGGGRWANRGDRGSESTGRNRLISVIVPIHREGSRLQAIRESIAPSSTPTELIIVVNNKELEGIVRAEGPRERVVVSERMGRGHAFVRGATEARGDVLVLLHSDTVLPPKWDRAIAKALDDDGTVGGAFSLSFDVPSLYLKALIFSSDLFYHLTGEVWGDRAIFVRSGVLRRCLAAMDVPLLEDVRLSKCMRGLGTVIVLKERVITSAEGFMAYRRVRHAWKALKCRFLYALGASPQRMYEYYYKRG